MMGLFNRADSNSAHLLKGLKYRSAFTKNARNPGRTEAGNETVVPPEVPLTINSSIRCPLFFAQMSQNISNCLTLPDSTLLFLKKRASPKADRRPNSGIVSFSNVAAMGGGPHCMLTSLDTISIALLFLESLHFLVRHADRTLVFCKNRAVQYGAPSSPER